MEVGDAWQHVKTTLNRRDQITDRPGVESETTRYRQHGVQAVR